jgi:hypothetical protein
MCRGTSAVVDLALLAAVAWAVPADHSVVADPKAELQNAARHNIRATLAGSTCR